MQSKADFHIPESPQLFICGSSTWQSFTLNHLRLIQMNDVAARTRSGSKSTLLHGRFARHETDISPAATPKKERRQ